MAFNEFKMGYQFLVKSAGHLSTIKIWCLDVELIDGNIEINTIAVTEIDGKMYSVLVKSVAFVDPPRMDNIFTLSIGQPEFSIALLEGRVLKSEI